MNGLTTTGLAISKHLVTMNNGTLGVTSNVGQGSSFYFTWPFSIVTPSTSASPGPKLQSHFSVRSILAPEVAFETRAIVIEPLTESRQLLGRILSQQNIQVTLYESCENVVQDEQERHPDLLGPDGSVLMKHYRSNAHFFFATRTSCAETIVETARALAMLFKQRNEQKQASGDTKYKSALSIVLVIFSSPHGRYLAKDMIKRIRANGLEDTVQCRYIVKPVKIDRVMECLRMLGSYAPFNRGMTGEPPKITQAGTLQHGYSHSNSEGCQGYPNGNANTLHQAGVTESQATDNFTLLSSDYERDNDSNKNTPEASSLDPDGRADMPDTKSVFVKTNEEPAPSHQVGPTNETPSHTRLSAAALRRQRLRSNGEGTTGAWTVKDPSGAQSTDSTGKCKGDNSAFSNRSARAAAGKRERKGKCVLCVEDNIINLKVVQYQLQKLGYDTLSACDGQVAVDIIKAQVEMLGQSGKPSLNGDSQEETGGTSSIETSLGSQDTSHGSSLTSPLQLGLGCDLLLNPESNKNMSHGFDHTSMATPTMERALSSMILASSLLSPSSSSASLDTTMVNATATISTISATANPSDALMDSVPSSSPNKHTKIDLILMDCAMPVKSGFDAASEIRLLGMSSEFAAKIPIIALTASAVPSTKEKCIAAGMNGYLSKPTKLTNLEAMLSQWIA
ncbi:hypothetical protein BGZ65_008794 [Modicella reniformis]|uniref:Response regulatory domain-containing protein n=1 Tax=Modicella reniformis TaxID=1440133 RepID=A0A9P6IJ48_9FUNG|nr:hypothetical protein BGZ65_008794 [Modicella reniformis]